MKKVLVLVLVAATLLTFISCNSYNGSKYEEYSSMAKPQNGIFAAPDTFYHEWDIPSVRDASVSKEGYYSMPIYRFDTYAELLHLKDIVGMNLIGNEVSNTTYCYDCGTGKTCPHDQYTEAFFENFSLLIGWCQYKGLVLPEHVESPDEYVSEEIATYTINRDGDLIVYLEGNYANSEAELTSEQQWILVAVPKETISACDSITFLVKLPTEEVPDENPEGTPDENPEGTPDENPEGTPDENPEGTPDENPESTPEDGGEQQ